MGRKLNSGLSIGVHGQLSFENLELLNKLNEQASVGDLVLNHPSNNYLKYISNRNDKDVNNTFDVVGHGNVKCIQVISADGKKIISLSHRDLVKLLKRNKNYKKGMSIRLLSCNTGKDPYGFAQNLANKLNVKVIAPSSYYWAYPNGMHLSADMKENGQIDRSRPGKMITFYPGGYKHD